MKIYRELAGQTLIYGLGTIVPRILNFLLTPLYTYTLVESEFGIITYLFSYVAFLMVILTFGMETTFFRFSSSSNNKNLVFSTAFFILVITSTIFMFLFFAFQPHIYDLISYKGDRSLIKIIAFIIFFDVVTSVPLARLRQENKAKFFAIIRSLNVLINLSLNIFFFVICKDSTNPVLNGLYNDEIGVGYAFISNLVASVFTFIVLIPSFGFFTFNIDWVLIKDMFKYSIPLVVVGFAGMVNEVADKIFLNFLTPNGLNPMEQIGIYGANYKLAVLMTIFIQMFRYAAEPFFFKQANNADAKQIYSKVMTYFVIFCLFIFLIVTLYIDIFKLLIDVEYRVGLKIVPIILLANIFLGIYYNLSIWYKVNNLTIYGAIIAFVGLLITVLLNIILIPKYGYMGSAIATIICYFSIVVISYYIGRYFYRVEYQKGNILVYFTTALLLYGISVVLPVQNIWLKYILATSFIVCFLLVVAKIEKLNFAQLKTFIFRT